MKTEGTAREGSTHRDGVTADGAPTTAASVAEGPLELHVDGPIATVWLSRPAAYNALSEAMLDALASAFDAIASRQDIRVVVLAARGKAFCAGHDLREMRREPSHAYYQSLFARCTRVMMAMRRLPQPVIARVQGIATAAGCQLVAMADLAVASEDARLAVSGVNLGLFCSTPSVPLSRNLPAKRAFEMLMTGEFVDARTARDLGLVNRVVPAADLDAQTLALARRIAQQAPEAVRVGKRLFYRQLEMGVEAAYQLAGQTMACNMMDADALAGVQAFLDKQPMPWAGDAGQRR
ncbi:MAG: enoyl-CoA hydratase [Lautropia sp.]